MNKNISQEKAFLLFLRRILFISLLGLVLLIPILNAVFLTYVWSSDRSIKVIKNLLFKKELEKNK